MPQVTQIRVVYSRTKQPAQYESQRAEVELTIALAEDEELGNVISEHMGMVRDEAHRVLGIAPRPPAQPQLPAQSRPAAAQRQLAR